MEALGFKIISHQIELVTVEKLGLKKAIPLVQRGKGLIKEAHANSNTPPFGSRDTLLHQMTFRCRYNGKALLMKAL
jgi:hypothetical protein